MSRAARHVYATDIFAGAIARLPFVFGKRMEALVYNQFIFKIIVASLVVIDIIKL